MMNMTELTRLMTGLRKLGLTDTQIVDLLLYIGSGEDVSNTERKEKS